MNRMVALLIAIDFILAMLAYQSAALLRLGSLAWAEMIELVLLKGLLFAATLLLAGYFLELYRSDRNNDWKEILLRVIAALILSFFCLTALYFLVPQIMTGRGNLALALLIFGALQFAWHLRYPMLLKLPGVAQKILILGAGPLAGQIEKVLGVTRHNYVLTGFVQPVGEIASISSRVLEHAEDLAGMARKEKISKIIISLSERRGVLPVRDILGCKLNGIEIIDAMAFYEQVTGKLMIEKINPSWFIFSDGFRVTPVMRFNKRLLDLTVSFFGLIMSLPIFLLAAVVIKLDTPGPVFFRQVRVGKGEKEFVLYKFRTMRLDAEKDTGAVWAQENDPRATRVGRILRLTRIDELPQLFNVLMGDMSIVGPRPERPEFVTILKEKIPYYSNRHCLKPGATGWAQVRYSYGASVEDAVEKLRYDLYYVKNYSLFLDFLIILETVKVVLCGRGAR
jgi:sugar transferase (PEP-CTERM system associated)